MATDHTKALAEALQAVLDCLEDYQECKASESARDALDAYRASEQSKALDLLVRNAEELGLYDDAPKQPTKNVLTDAYESMIGKPLLLGPSTAVELPEPGINTSNHAHARVIGYTTEQLTAYGNARAAEARRAALEEAADEADHWIGFDKTASDACDDIAAAIRSKITKE